MANEFKYEGINIKELDGLDDPFAQMEVSWRIWAQQYVNFDILTYGVNIAPIFCNPILGRPSDREPKPPVPRPIVGGLGGGVIAGLGGTWKKINDNNDYQLIYE